MSKTKWFVEIEVNEDILKESYSMSGAGDEETIPVEDIISRELDWCRQSGITVKTLKRDDD